MDPSPTVGFARLPQSGLIELRARYGDRPGPYLLDSGSMLDVVNSAVHPFEPGEEVDTTVLYMEGESLAVHTYEAEPFLIGRYAHQPPQVIAVEVPYTASDGGPMHGLLGHPLFQETPIGIDWGKQTLTFGPVPPALGVRLSLPVEITGEHACVLAILDGEPLKLLLETAAPFEVLLHRPDFDPAPFQSDEEAGTRRFTLPRLAVEGGGLSGVAAVHDPDPKAPADGRIGLGVLSRYNLWIDYPGERVLLMDR
ncbi:MAG TPA: hypothetical protein VEI97_00345 [bacterium]|nr:hypothetical protein [bacterium]